MYALAFSESENFLRTWAESAESPNIATICVIQNRSSQSCNSVTRHNIIIRRDVIVSPVAVATRFVYDANGRGGQDALKNWLLEAVNCDVPPLSQDIFAQRLR